MRPLYALMVLSTLSLKIGLCSPKHLLLSFSPFFFLLSLPLFIRVSVYFFSIPIELSSFNVLLYSSTSVQARLRLFFPPYPFFATSRGSCGSPGYSSMSVIFVTGFSSLFVRRGPSCVPLKIISSGIPRRAFRPLQLEFG